jgi:hypothetical protein
MRWTRAPLALVAQNYKVASTSIARACAELAGQGGDGPEWHRRMAAGFPVPDGRAALMVREPVDRFVAAMRTVGCGSLDEFVSRTLEDVEALAPGRRPRPPFAMRGAANLHFHPQARYAMPGVELYRFPDHLEAFCSAVGLPWPMPLENASGAKPRLSDAERRLVAEWYAADTRLFESIERPGQVADGALLSTRPPITVHGRAHCTGSDDR